MHIHHDTFAGASLPLFTRTGSPASLPRGLRQAVESEIERMIDWLDGLEGDADLEPYLSDSSGDDREADYHGSVSGVADDEPSLGFADHRSGRGISRFEASVSSGWGMTDLEHDDCDHEESDHSGCGDAEGLIVEERGEVELGATEDVDQSLAWASPAYHAPGVGCFVTDGEPSLGWTGHGYGLTGDIDSPRDDRESDAGDEAEVDDDREPCPDVMGEWSLGSVECVHQGAWSHGEGRDLRTGR